MLSWPIREEFAITATFAETNGPYKNNRHRGLDIASKKGRVKVYPVSSGIVVWKSKECPPMDSSCNNEVMIYHPQWRLFSLYSHLEFPAAVQFGAEVDADTVIGTEGTTGAQYDPCTKKTVRGWWHLHLEFGKYQFSGGGSTGLPFTYKTIHLYDPLPFFPKDKIWEKKEQLKCP